MQNVYLFLKMYILHSNIFIKISNAITNIFYNDIVLPEKEVVGAESHFLLWM